MSFGRWLASHVDWKTLGLLLDHTVSAGAGLTCYWVLGQLASLFLDEDTFIFAAVHLIDQFMLLGVLGLFAMRVVLTLADRFGFSDSWDRHVLIAA